MYPYVIINTLPSSEDGGCEHIASDRIGTSSTGTFATSCDSLKVTLVVAPDIIALGCMVLMIGTGATSVELLISRASIISMKRRFT